jgi:peptidoglycan glycosyltransferase
VNRQIRRMGVAMLGLFSLLLLQLTYLQAVSADRLANHPGNTRAAVRDFGRARGAIQTQDGTILARSRPAPAGSAFNHIREYPEGGLFGHITGFFSFTFGADGVERAYNDVLAGRDVRIQDLRDVLVEQERTANVTLTLRKSIQEVAARELGERRGAVVALDPSTGAVLAMYSFPSYDPTPLASHSQSAVRDAWALLNVDPARPMLPRTYRETFAPGSTFKVVTAAAALEHQPDLVTKTYPTLRALDLPRSEADLPNFGGGACGGQLADLLRVSCNTGFGQMGLDLGAETLVDTAEAFGFNDRPPLDLPAVARSAIPEVDAFERNEPALAKSAIGQQDVRATPLQMALVAAAIGNGGSVPAPRVMFEVRDEEGEVVRRGEASEWKRAMTADSAVRLRDMMINVINNGTGGRAALPGVQVAGKTGTAQTVGDNAHAWFIAFAPADAPQVAVAVVVESQDGVTEATGGRVAAPIARAVMEAALQAGPLPEQP